MGLEPLLPLVITLMARVTGNYRLHSHLFSLHCVEPFHANSQYKTSAGL